MRLTIIAALLVGLVLSFYHWAIPNLWQVKNYSPLVLNQNSPSFAVDETFYYGSKVRKILNGRWPDGAETGEAVGVISMAILAKISGGIDKAFILADFIFPALTFLILAYLLNLWLKNRLLALTATLFVLTFYHYLTYFPYLPSVVKLMVQYWKEGSYSSLIRGFHPQISLGLFFIFAAFLWKKSSWWLIALLLALLTYTHFFYWTAALIWLIFFYFDRRLIKILTVWFILTLPYWFFVIRLLPAVDFWQRNYFYLPPTINQLLLLALGFLLAWRQKFWLSFYSGISTLLIFTVFLKLGPDDPIGHWFLRVVNPLTAILMIIGLFNKLKLRPVLLILICFLVLGFQFRLHWQYFKNNALAFRMEPAKLEAFNWLRQNSPANSVVVTDSLADSLYLPAYTQNTSYLKQAQLSQASNQELLQRFLEVNKTAGVKSEMLVKMFEDNNELKNKKRFNFDTCAGHYLYFREFNGSDYYSCRIPENKLQQILIQYELMTPQLTYPTDYWLWGPFEATWAQVNPDKMDKFKLLWENSKYKIYKLL